MINKLLDTTRLIILFISCSFTVTAVANENLPYEKAPGNNINEIALPLTEQTAAELAKLETNGKVLSVTTIKQGERTLFRVKVLHNNGKLKIHYFDQNTGHAVTE